jgi:hypothetical protein
MSRAKTIRVSDLRSKIVVCNADEVITADGRMRLDRRTAFDSWACIEAKRASAFFRDGGVDDAAKDKRSHVLTMRARPDKIVVAGCWIFEDLRLSPPRWYRVLGLSSTGDNGSFWVLDVRLLQADDLALPLPAQAPQAPALPPGVSL